MASCRECETILKYLMGIGLKEDPKDSRFTWEEDMHGNDSNAKIRDWDEALYQYDDAEDRDNDPLRPWCLTALNMM